MSDWDRFNDQFREDEDERNERLRKQRLRKAALDPRDPDPTREGVFRNHNCWKCDSGAKPCVVGNPRQCENLHARND